ncbi:MAG: ferrous iron transporter B, partial [Clostridia bacterium]|nr:ferrous iron transporter B [Clostridia bacterium]
MNITIALVGNPNSGKTTLFNALTGSNQYVGNWPGVTVERKEAMFEIGEDKATLVDLPGVYSLSPYSIEENITRHFIAQHQPEVVLDIVDATNLERNLYLSLQLMELERPVVIALNMMDELERHGEKIDCAALSRELGTPVIPISAKKKQGFDRLFQAIHEQAHNPKIVHPSKQYEPSTRDALREIIEALGGKNAHSAFDMDEHFDHRDENERDDDHGAREIHRHIGGYADEGDMDYAPPTRWVALKLLEGDELLKEAAQLSDAQRERIHAAVDAYVERGRKLHPGIDSLTLVVDARYQYIDTVLSRANFKRKKYVATTSDKIDRVATHKYLAFPIFFVVLALMFIITFGQIGSTLTGLTESLVESIGSWAETALMAAASPEWVRSLVLDGVIAGVGGVLVFLPQILLIFLFMSVLEDSGY